MEDRRRTAILKAQYRDATKEPHEYMKFYMTESDMSIWYVLFSGFTGDNNEYLGGEYLVRIKIPSNFPFNPPEFYFLTAQGLYGVETKVCVSIGEYHSDKYRAVLGVMGFCTNLISGLIGWRSLGSGIQIKTTTLSAKRTLAKASRQYNIDNHQLILDNINIAFAEYSSRWDLTKIPTEMRLKLGLQAPPDIIVANTSDTVGTASVISAAGASSAADTFAAMPIVATSDTSDGTGTVDMLAMNNAIGPNRLASIDVSALTLATNSETRIDDSASRAPQT